jgi:polyhydroxybutyrate depolymerase
MMKCNRLAVLLLGMALVTLFGISAFPTAPAQAQPALCGTAAPALGSGSSEHTLISGAVERIYRVYVPSAYDGSSPVPLVLSLHGMNSNAVEQERYSGWDSAAERENFIAVYPQGTGNLTHWVAFETGLRSLNVDGVDDVQFIRDLLAELNRNFCLDPARLYVSGISNGGAMTYRLACALSDQIAAVAMVAPGITRGNTCAPPRALPLLEFHGTEDSFVPYAGSEIFVPVQQWTEQWASHNGCDARPETLPTSGEVNGVHYDHCDESADVFFYTITGGGHTWPGAGSTARLDARLGHNTEDIDATETMWQFFVDHPLE